MAKRNRISFNTEQLFVGPSPATGHHNLHYTGTLTDNITDHKKVHNLIRPLRGINSFDLLLSTNRESIGHLGKKGLVKRPIINHPATELTFNYYVQGLANELAVGLNANFGQFEYPHDGTPYYSDNFSVDLLSGIDSRSLDKFRTDDPFFPFKSRDSRNFFGVIGQEGQDIARLPDYDFDDISTFNKNDSRVSDYHVVGIGNCYLRSYSTNASINSFPQASLSYICENIKFYDGGSGYDIPAVLPKDRTEIQNRPFLIPGLKQEDGPEALVPGDITVDIQKSNSTNAKNLGIKLQDTLLNSYNINLNLDRSDLDNIGYTVPIDRQVDYPVIANFSFDALVNQTETGSFEQLIDQDDNYDITIKLRQPCFQGDLTAPINAGKEQFNKDIAVRYDFLKAKLDNINYTTQVGENKTVSLDFSVELDSDELGNQGFYISGLHNIERIEDFVRHSGGFVTDENDNPIVANNIPFVL